MGDAQGPLSLSKIRLLQVHPWPQEKDRRRDWFEKGPVRGPRFAGYELSEAEVVNGAPGEWSRRALRIRGNASVLRG
jgi:hypothetical protein